jgi:hypothetical protein
MAINTRNPRGLIFVDPFIASPLWWINFDSTVTGSEEIMRAILHPLARSVHGDGLN